MAATKQRGGRAGGASRGVGGGGGPPGRRTVNDFTASSGYWHARAQAARGGSRSLGTKSRAVGALR
eukprot:15467695-Alexandrium_andersonii.AAC.1